jgi:hypothetical protein
MAATARKEAALVDRATLILLGVPRGASSVSVSRVSQGFAELDFAIGPRLVALDFLPPCVAGDVLALKPAGGAVQIEVDARATARAHRKLLKLLELVAPSRLP